MTFQKARVTELPSTGERHLTERFDENTAEHLHRYALAMELCKGRDILDIASGEGYGSNLLAELANTVVGVDISNEAVDHAQAKYKKSNLRYIKGSADRIPLDSNSVDLVVSFETLEHHDMHEEMFAEIKRVLRPGGTLLMSTPEKLYYSDIPNYQNAYHVKELYLEQFMALAQKFFRNTAAIFQAVRYGSIIVPENGGESFSYFRGTYQHLNSVGPMPEPIYNLCLASDELLPTIGPSFFDARQALDQRMQNITSKCDARIAGLSQQLVNISNSSSYRLGRALTWPIRKILGRK